MRILFLAHSFNSLTQRLYVVLRGEGHEVSVEFDINDTVTAEAVDLFRPDLIIAPFLKRRIASAIWKNHLCLIVHPGIVGDRGPSSLDWAILNQEHTWGVTVLAANAEMDAGDIWASVEFPMRAASKASLYRNEVTQAATQAVLHAVKRYQSGNFTPSVLSVIESSAEGQLRPQMKQTDRKIDWHKDDTQAVLRKIRSADGYPGVLDHCCGEKLYLYDAQPEAQLRGKPGELIGRCGPAICRATIDGAVWIGHCRDRQSAHPFKLAATTVLKKQCDQLPEIKSSERSGYRDIWYEQINQVGYLHFAFYNGAMGTEQCQRLLAAYRLARQQATRIIVLMGGPDFWSNGMHLNHIECATSAPEESWRNINAIDDLAKEIITTESHITVAALQGNAGAGGVFLARACDQVWARSNVILNPHYKDMGNLYGSEYWTYLLPSLVGEDNAKVITQARLPMGSREASELGLIDAHFGDSIQSFVEAVSEKASALASAEDYVMQLDAKVTLRLQHESIQPLESYRQQELERMKMNFFGFDPSYHVARYNFVYKIPKSRTPLTIAEHRRNRTMRKVS